MLIACSASRIAVADASGAISAVETFLKTSRKPPARSASIADETGSVIVCSGKVMLTGGMPARTTCVTCERWPVTPVASTTMGGIAPRLSGAGTRSPWWKATSKMSLTEPSVPLSTASACTPTTEMTLSDSSAPLSIVAASSAVLPST